jgi:hypothetical protein
MQYQRNIGIDFGTSTTVLCYLDYEVDEQGQKRLIGGPDPIKQLPNCDKHEKPIETLIYEPAEGDLAFGLEARRQAEDDKTADKPRKGTLVYNFKMNLMDSDPAKAALAVAHMKLFFDFLYRAYSANRRYMHDQKPHEQTFVSFPAKWPQHLREVTLEAASACFPEVTGIDEPCAAMQYFLYYEHSESFELIKEGIIAPGQELKVLLIDLGGGTTDYVLYKTKLGNAEGHEVLCTWPPDTAEATNLGGKDIDRLMVRDVTSYFNTYKRKKAATVSLEVFEGRRSDIVSFKEGRLSKGLERLCKAWEEGRAHSNTKQAVDNVPYQTSFEDAHHVLQSNAPEYAFTLESFGEMAQDHLKLFVDLTNGAIRHAKDESKIADASEIDLVILAGGHSQWYFVPRLLAGKWLPGSQTGPASGSGIRLPQIASDHRRCWSYRDPQTIVARGLVLANLGYSITGIAQHSLWYKIEIAVAGSRNLWTLQVVPKGLALPKSRAFFVRLPFQRPLSDSGDLKIEANIIQVVGESPENGRPFDRGPLSRTMPGSTLLKDRVRRFLNYPAVTEFIDVYLSAKMDQYGTVSYRGIIQLGSGGEPWIFKSSSGPISEDETTSLQKELAAHKSGARTSAHERS